MRSFSVCRFFSHVDPTTEKNLCNTGTVVKRVINRGMFMSRHSQLRKEKTARDLFNAANLNVNSI